MKKEMEEFFSSPAYAVVGVSPNRKKFGNVVFRSMQERSFVVYPVNPKHRTVEDAKCFASVKELPDDVRSVVTVVPPEVTEHVLHDCVEKGIRTVWMQPGSESKAALDYAAQNNIEIISRECILMFLEPVKSIHGLHRMIKKLVGRYAN